MCSSLILISKHVGRDFSMEQVFPELKELLEDEEGEVVTEAIISLQKHVSHVFTAEFIRG